MPQNKTSIEWTDLTVNPIRARDGEGHTGHYCEKISPGCANCYASGLQRRFRMPEFQAQRSRKDIEVFLDEKRLLDLLKIRKPQHIFPFDMTDLFGDWVPDEWIDKFFAIAALTPHITYQVLTKRAQRAYSYLADEGIFGRIDLAAADLKATNKKLLDGRRVNTYETAWPLRNVWLGVSCENQEMADERIPLLLQTPAAVRWVSAEPLLGPIDFANIGRDPESGDEISEADDALGSPLGGVQGIDWIIVGGESGPKARPMHPDWARSIRDQCQAAGVAFFFKQWGACIPLDHASPKQVSRRDTEAFFDMPTYRVGKKAAGRLLDGVEYSEFPEVRG